MPLGLGGNSSFYWSPNPPATEGGNSPVGKQILENSIPTAFYRYGVGLGVPDNQSAFSRWFQQQEPKFNLGYNAYTVSNPLTANLGDYTAQLGGYQDWLKQFMQMAPQLRGEDPNSRGGGPARWISR